MQEVVGEPCLITAIKDGVDGNPGGDDVIQQEVTYYKATSTGTAPNAPSSGDSTTGWSTTRPTPSTSYPFVWCCIRRKYSISGWKWGAVELVDFIRARLRVLSPSDWPTGNNTKKVYKGDPGEPYQDVYINTNAGSNNQGVFFECIASGYISANSPFPENMYKQPTGAYVDASGTGSSTWMPGTFWPSFGTALLVAIKAYIKELVVGELFSETANGLFTTVTGGSLLMGYNNKTHFRLAVDDEGNAVLQYLDGNDHKIGQIDKSFFATMKVGAVDSWDEQLYKPLGNAWVDINWSSVSDVKPQNCTTYFRFNEGYDVNIQTGDKTYTHNQNQVNTPSTYDGKWFQSKSIGNYVPQGFYVKPNNGVHKATAVIGNEDPVYQENVYKSNGLGSITLYGIIKSDGSKQTA